MVKGEITALTLDIQPCTYISSGHNHTLTVELSQPNTHNRSLKSLSFTVSSIDTPS